MAELGGYADHCERLELHLGAMAGVLGRFRSALLEQGFAESEATALALTW